jgi:hypothetical protein
MSNYLSKLQVFELNEKHGWFQYGDAQSDVSNAFAQDAIEMHERMRAAAPDLLKALADLLAMCERQVDFNDDGDGGQFERCQAAINKATGAA